MPASTADIDSTSPETSPADQPELATDSQPPLYAQLAQKLRHAIAAGTYPIGARLPTEHQLCEQYQVSRFTAREAVRILADSGLVVRKQRVGTIVTATSGSPRYTHNATSVRDLLQYAQDTQLRFAYIGKLALSKALAEEFGAQAGAEWVYCVGIRVAGTLAEQAAGAVRPICVTRLYLNPMLEGIETRLRGRRDAVHTLIESNYGILIERVEQDLQGISLDAEDAANLGATPGAAGLRIVRRYYSAKGELLEIADNVHAGDRFTYHMEMRK
ncbi:MAG TPA: GntR family transcriptional regulator [Paraburkholderia sp.]|uniref:GntR family transcriptional regulator n=1 Tax=Paraburkholderia sp. TaxID=1926495 RepID=UPI002C9E535F|nr:GntR family transcriptional regulator [Paraburkholderia sp.]HTR10622.1 GntR family transcriptional regulator [Paraburkholderia sp.]